MFSLFSCVVVKRSFCGGFFYSKKIKEQLIFEEEFVEFVTAAASLHSFLQTLFYLRARAHTQNTKQTHA